MSSPVTQRFAYGVTTVDIPLQLPRWTCKPTRGQNIQQTWGGEVRLADRATKWYVTDMTVIMPRSTLQSLETFWADTVKGGYLEFTWTDYRSTAHALARFLDRELNVTMLNGGVAEVKLRIRTAERMV